MQDVVSIQTICLTNQNRIVSAYWSIDLDFGYY